MYGVVLVLVGQAPADAENRAPRARVDAESWGSDREALAALRATAAQHEPSALRGHARAESVGPLAMQVARLERAFHRGLRLRQYHRSGARKGSPGGPENGRGRIRSRPLSVNRGGGELARPEPRYPQPARRYTLAPLPRCKPLPPSRKRLAGRGDFVLESMSPSARGRTAGAAIQHLDPAAAGGRGRAVCACWRRTGSSSTGSTSIAPTASPS